VPIRRRSRSCCAAATRSSSPSTSPGPADYTLIVDCAGAEGLDDVIRWLKAEAGVARTESKFVLRPVVG